MIVSTAVVAVLLAAVFVAGSHLHLLRDRRAADSIGAGVATAYVFVHVLPELQGARAALVASAPVELWFEGIGINFLALVGFLAFYGLEHVRGRTAGSLVPAREREFRIHIGGFAAYVVLVTYLLLHGLEHTETLLELFAIAMMFHFLAIDHHLHHEHGAAYERTGRWILAAACLLGWGIGLLLTLPPYVSALLLAFVSGGIIVNSAIMELPSEKDGRFLPFAFGALVFGAILVPLG